MSRYGYISDADYAQLSGHKLPPIPGQPRQGAHRVGGRYIQRGTAGKRPLLGNQFFRSKSEACYASYLRWQGIDYQYEAKRFVFPGITGANASMLPDFFLPAEDRYIEVKGWMSQNDAIKIRRLAKYYPEIRLHVIRYSFFQDLCRQRICLLIPGYECAHR